MIYPLWEGKAPGAETEVPTLEFYPPIEKKSDAAVILFAGGGYSIRNRYEDFSYAQFLNNFGLTAFVVNYRLEPAHFPDQLLDARRAVRLVRARAAEFGVDPQKLIVMGSSAGGHVSALVSTYLDPIAGEGADEIDAIDPIPNGQVLCYAVISGDEAITHPKSMARLLPGELIEKRAEVSAERLVTKRTPPAFIWHTAEDASVSVLNSYRYATALREAGIPCELHVFPFGHHGLAMARTNPHVAQWVELLHRWLMVSGFLPSEV